MVLGAANGTPQSEAHRHHKQRHTSHGTAPTVAASQLLFRAAQTPTALAADRALATPTAGAPPARGGTHAFTSAEAEAVLGMSAVVVKVISAKDLPEAASGGRRSCVATLKLVGADGAPLDDGALDARTGPPNQWSTVKDTAPVWSAEFTTPADAGRLGAGASLNLDVWDDAVAPPVRIGAAASGE